MVFQEGSQGRSHGLGSLLAVTTPAASTRRNLGTIRSSNSKESYTFLAGLWKGLHPTADAPGRPPADADFCVSALPLLGCCVRETPPELLLRLSHTPDSQKSLRADANLIDLADADMSI
jgi:hypothetical protein